MSSQTSLKLSWGEVLVVLLLVTGGTGVWRLTQTFLDESEEPAAAKTEASSPSRANEDHELRRMSADLDGLRAALLEKRIDVSRQETLRTWLRRHHPDLQDELPACAVPAPADVRAEYDSATRALEISRELARSLSVDVARAETMLDEGSRANETKATDALAAKKRQALRRKIRARIWAAASVLILLVIARIVLRKEATRAVIPPNRTVGLSALLLLLIGVYDVLGAPGLMLGALGLALLVRRTVVVKS